MAIPLLILVGLLLFALLLPLKRDTSVKAWWVRVRYQLIWFARIALILLASERLCRWCCYR